jgi:muconolactone delta-isomerase
LTVTGDGDPDRRPAAARWLRAAPAADSTWEYRSSQEADPNALTGNLEIAGASIDLSETKFGLNSDLNRMRMHVSVYHPSFRQLPTGADAQVSFLLLDWLLGEDDVERWIGSVDAVTESPDEPVAGDKVIEAVNAIRQQTNPDEWAIASWQDENGSQGLASYRPALRRVDYPTHDLYQQLSVSYPTRADGLPADAEVLESLRALEDEMQSSLAGRGVLVAYDTISGQRTFHLYTDSEDQNATDVLTRWARQHRLQIRTVPDPSWQNVRRFVG